MLKTWYTILLIVGTGYIASAQVTPRDSAIIAKEMAEMDTTLDYEELFRDFDAFMDSLLMPGSYLVASFSAGKGYYTFESKGSAFLTTTSKLTYTPTIGYYHKSGLGIAATGYMVDDGYNMNLYQGSFTGSYDYLKDRRLATGLAYTKFFTRDSLPFYTTPLQNELYGYFTWRQSWVRPTVAVSYGWGSRTDYSQRLTLIQDLRLRRRGFTYINTEESISDFSVMGSVRHDFYWLDVITSKDHIRFTPQLTFTSGTQKFGFNQSMNTYGTSVRTGNNVLFNSDNFYLDDHLEFQPLSLTLFLRGEYSFGKFFIQPQLALDYYFPVKEGNFNTLLSVNAGLVF